MPPKPGNAFAQRQELERQQSKGKQKVSDGQRAQSESLSALPSYHLSSTVAGTSNLVAVSNQREGKGKGKGKEKAQDDPEPLSSISLPSQDDITPLVTDTYYIQGKERGSDDQGTQTSPYSTSKPDACSRLVAIPCNLVIPESHNEWNETTSRAQTPSPTVHSCPTTPSEASPAELLVPRRRSKGKEKAQYDPEVQFPSRFAEQPGVISSSAEGSANLISSEDSSQSKEKGADGNQMQSTLSHSDPNVSSVKSSASLAIQKQEASNGYHPQQSGLPLRAVRPRSATEPQMSQYHCPTPLQLDLPVPMRNSNSEDKDKHTNAITLPENFAGESNTNAQYQIGIGKAPYSDKTTERPSILAQLIAKFNVRDFSGQEDSMREKRKEETTMKNITESNNTIKQLKISLSGDAEQSRHESSGAKYCYPKQKHSEDGLNSAPLLPPNSSNTMPHTEMSSSSLCESPFRLRRTSSAPALPKQDMYSGDESSYQTDDNLPRQPIQGIIMGGPSLSPTRQGSYATHRHPGIVEQRLIPSMHGIIGDASAPSTLSNDPSMLHNHIDGVANDLMQHLSSTQGNMLNVLMGRMEGLASEINMLRMEINAFNFHLGQLTDRVVAIEEGRSGLSNIDQANGRRGVNLNEPNRRNAAPMTRTAGVQTRTSSGSSTPLSNGYHNWGQPNVLNSRPGPGHTHSGQAPAASFGGMGYRGSVKTPYRHANGGPTNAGYPPHHDSQPRSGGPVRNIGRGGPISQQRVGKQPRRVVPPPQPDISADPSNSGQYQRPCVASPVHPAQHTVRHGYGSGSAPTVASAVATSIPAPPTATTPNTGGQSTTRSRGPSTDVKAWGGISDWYHRAYPDNRNK